MRIVWIGLLLLACGQPQTGQVHNSSESHEHGMVLGLTKNNSGTYELQLCKDGNAGASECVNPLATANGVAYSFNIRGTSWWAQSLRWGAGGLAAFFGSVGLFKASRYFLRKAAAVSLARELNADTVAEELAGKGQKLTEKLRLALQRRRLGRDDGLKLLVLRNQHDIDIKAEAKLLKDWGEHVTKLRDALKEGEVFIFKDEFNTNLENMRGVLDEIPSQNKTLVEFDHLTEALRRNKISKGQAMNKLSALENRVQQQFGKLVERDWHTAMQQAQQALERSTNYDGLPAVKKGQQVMHDPLNKLKEGKTVRRLSRLEKYGTRRAGEMKEEIQKVFDKIEAIRNRHLRAAGMRIETKGKLDHRDELLRVLQDLELVARNEKENGRARKLKALARDIQNGKADQGEVAKRMHGIDKDWQSVKDVDSEDAWQSGLGKVDAMLTDERSINDYKQLHAALRELQHYLIEIGDKGNANQIKKIEKKMAKRLKSKRSVSTRELDESSEKAMKIVNHSRKHNKWKKTVEQMERGSEEMNSGLEDSNLVQPKQALQRSLNRLESLAQKLGEVSISSDVRKLRTDIDAKRLQREQIEEALTSLDKAMHDSSQFMSLDDWRESITQVKSMLNSNNNLYDINPNLDGIWDEMITTLEGSKPRATFAPEIDELKRYTLDGKWQEDVIDRKLVQIDSRVRKTGNFRTVEELLAVQGKERRAARGELRQQLAELRRELNAKVKTKAASLDTALRAGEQTRKAKQGRLDWFKYGNGGERVVNRDQVLAALRNGEQLDAIEVRIGLEKLAAQLTGATIFVTLPFVLADGEASQSNEPQELLPLLQHIAQAVDANITPTASCLLGTCAAGDRDRTVQQ